jgi:phosphinothricin acetyltransferase
MLIRPARSTDFDAIATLTNRSIVGSAIHFGYEPVSGAELRDLWSAKRERYPWLVAELEGGAFAGYAKAGVWRERAAYAWVVETAVYVEPAAHRQGVGKALYARLLTVLREQGYHMAVAGITLPNEGSVRLHEAAGFEFVGRFAEVGWKLGAWHDVGFWQARLAPVSESAAEISAPRQAP